HEDPRLVKTLKDGSKELLHVSNLFYHPAQGILGERLVRASGLRRAFFCNSGTEANEAALKFARLANPGKSEVVALVESFHGRTLGALSLTGHEAYRTPFEPLVPGVRFVAPNDGDAIEGVVKPGHHGTTFGGNPVACRLGIAVLDEIGDSSLLARVNEIGEWFGNELCALQSRTSSIVEVRGMGMMWGIELDRPAK